MANNFDPDFYITCATVIPVLFLAATVGRSYETVLKTALDVARSRSGDRRWARQVLPYMLARVLKLTAYGVWVAGTIGELIALSVLYQGYEQWGERKAVMAAMVVLVAAAGAGPLGAYVNVRSELDKLAFGLPVAPSRDGALPATQPTDVPGSGSPAASDGS